MTDRSCAGSPCTIGGLVNGESYTVTVAAINTAGTGPVSSATGSLTPATAAYAVGALSAVPGDTVVDLSWTALSTPQLGGGSFTRYEVSYRAAGVSPTPAWTLATSALTTQSTSSYRVTGLDNGTSYDFQVVAITSANTAEIAGNTAQVVQYPSTVPGVPRTLTVLAATPTDVQFSWATPLTDGGSTITGYTTTVTSTTSGATTPITCSVSGTTTRCDASSLTNGAVYTLTVEATNRMSTGSNGNVASTTYNVPSADATLSALVVTGSAGVVTLTPTFDASTTDYTASVNYDVSSVTVTPTTTAAAATVTVEGTAVVSGVASGSVALGVGANSIEVEVTASDTRFSETYTVAVTRGAAPVSNSGGGGTDTTPAVIGVDLEPFQPTLEAPETNNGEALYIDANGQARSTPQQLLVRPGATPSLIVGEPGDLMVTLRANEADATSHNDTQTRLVVRREMATSADGSGFMPDTTVELWMFSTPHFLGNTTVRADGSWTIDFVVPASLVDGEHHLQAEGTHANGTARAIRAVVDVAEAVETPAPMLLPETGHNDLVLQLSVLLAALGAMILLRNTRRRAL